MRHCVVGSHCCVTINTNNVCFQKQDCYFYPNCFFPKVNSPPKKKTVIIVHLNLLINSKVYTIFNGTLLLLSKLTNSV